MIGRGVFEGVAGAYPRALYRSMGFVDADFEKPLIGIANSWSEVDPGHFHLRTLAEWVKEGVREAGGAPAEFNTVAPCDGIAQGQGMHAILPLRDVIAASVELMALANRFDGLVMLCSCDKIVPGMLIAAARLNLPTIFVLGGPMAPGSRRSRHGRAARDHPQRRERGDGPLQSRAHHRGRVLRDRVPGVRRPRRVRLHGHGQHDGLHRRDAGADAARLRHAARARSRARGAVPRHRPAHRRSGARGRARGGDVDAGEPGERRAGHAGARRLDQCDAAPARGGARGRRGDHAGHLRSPGADDAAHRQVRARQPADRGRSARGGRRPGGAERAVAAAGRRRADGGWAHCRPDCSRSTRFAR